MATPPMHKMHFPIVTKEAFQFWGSRHKCNRVKAIIAFSTDLKDANYNLRRFGYPAHLRLRALYAYKHFAAKPDMANIPFSPMSVPWYECMPKTPVPPTKGRWAVWDDKIMWDDNGNWIEWIPDPTP